MFATLVFWLAVVLAIVWTVIWLSSAMRRDIIRPPLLYWVDFGAYLIEAVLLWILVDYFRRHPEVSSLHLLWACPLAILFVIVALIPCFGFVAGRVVYYRNRMKSKAE